MTSKGTVQKYGFGDRDDLSPLRLKEHQGDEELAFW